MDGFTLVIPAFNAEATIGEAIRSALDQTVPPTIILVVDDGSSDSTAAVAAGSSERVRVIRQENAGPGAATTRGFAEVNTPFVATLDADDLWLPGKAERQLAAFVGAPGLAATFSHLRLFAADPNDSRHERVTPGWSRTTLMMRTALFHRVGAMIDPPGRRGELVDWLARARAAGEKLMMMEDVLALRRIRPGSLSDGRDEKRDRGYLHAAWKAIERRRAGGRGV